MVQNPPVILADEPISSLDPERSRDIVQLLVDLSQNSRKTLVASLHAVEFALSHFQRIIGLKFGRLFFDLPADQVTTALINKLYNAPGGGLMGEGAFRAGSGYAIESPVRPSAFNRKTLWLLIALGVITWSVLQTGVFRENLVNAGGWSTAARFFSAVLHPDFSFNFLRLTLEATITTLAYAVLGIFLSTIFGFFGGILGLRDLVEYSPPIPQGSI